MENLYKLEKIIDLKIKHFETVTLPTLRNLGLTNDLISADSLLREKIFDIDGVWDSCNLAFWDKCKELGIEGAREMLWFRDYDSLNDIHSLIWDVDRYLTDALNTGAGKNYNEYKKGMYDIEHPHSSNGVTYGVITNSFSAVLAAEFLRGFVDVISQTTGQMSVNSNFYEKQRRLISIINQTWYNTFDSKLKVLILETDKNMKEEIIRNITPKFGYTIEEYTEWKKDNIKPIPPSKKNFTSIIEDIQNAIDSNQQEMNSLGNFPFGKKAKRRKELYEENILLEKEISALKSPKEIKDLFTSFSVIRRGNSISDIETYYEHDIHLEYNSSNNLYRVIVHTDRGEQVLTSFTRDFTIKYGRLRQIYGTICGAGVNSVGDISRGIYRIDYDIWLNEN